MARHIHQGAAKLWIRCFGTDLLTGQIEMHLDDLDHVATEERQVLLGHRFHSDVLCWTNGPDPNAFQWRPPQLDA